MIENTSRTINNPEYIPWTTDVSYITVNGLGFKYYGIVEICLVGMFDCMGLEMNLENEVCLIQADADELASIGCTAGHLAPPDQIALGLLSAYFDELPADDYLSSALGLRKRAYSEALVTGNDIIWSEPAQFIQSKKVNALYGGQERKFSPLCESFRNEPILSKLVCSGAVLMGQETTIGVHAIRTIATESNSACPTPEGIHQDGFSFVSIHLCKKSNVAIGGGICEIFNEFEASPFKLINLEVPGDSLFINDERLLHYVRPFTPMNTRQVATRDVFVFTYGAPLK